MTPDVLGGLEYLGLPPSAETALAGFTAPLRHWFRERFETPTAAQRLAWPSLRAGRHLLLAAPTGGGKTVAAFAPILDALLAAPFATAVRCLYVAPLKALANDVRKALRSHLHGLRAFLPASATVPRVALRTGDTSARARRNLLLEPPDILLTTPESLSLLLSHPSGAQLFNSLCWLVVDEVHALAAGKRGADLALSLERLAEMIGSEPQRIGLSATCTPLSEAARFLVGQQDDVTPRHCVIAQVADTTPLELTVEPLPASGGFLQELVERVGPELAACGSTLIFATTRSLAERLSWALRRRYPEWDKEIAVHHSALAALRRRRIEQHFKRGRLRAVVCSTSLELGIDVGAVDRVVLVHPPGEVVRLLQRVGRSGHEPSRPRRGLILTANPAELLEAAVTTASASPAQCEPLRLPRAPLDVLCQQLLGMAIRRGWLPEEAFFLVRRAYPYRNLSRADFDDCLRYLSGRPSGAALPPEASDGATWLPARLGWEEGKFSVSDARTARIIRRNLGTIFAEDTWPVLLMDGRMQDGTDGDTFPRKPAPRPLGELDETFAEQLQPGARFLLDGRCLEFRRREGQNLLVEEVPGRPAVPRWTGEGPPLSAELAQRLYLLRLQASAALRQDPTALRELLVTDYALSQQATAALVAFFQRQECVSEIPDAATCLIEVVPSGNGVAHYLHTPLHQAGNDALARVAVLRLAREQGHSATSLVADLGFALLLSRPVELTPAELRSLLRADGFDTDLANALAGSIALREHFRRVALTALMLLRNPLGQRRRVGGPDWAESRLFDEVEAADPDFVLLRQARCEVREEACDAAAARAFVEGLPRCTLRCRQLRHPSPFAEAWTQLLAGPADSVEGPEEALRRLHATLTRTDPESSSLPSSESHH